MLLVRGSRQWLRRQNGKPAQQTQNATDFIDRSDRRLQRQSFDAVRERELKRRLRGRLVLSGRRSVPPSMFEEVRTNNNSSNRLALHRAERYVDGVCDGDARNRRPSRCRFRADPANENARLVPLPGQRGADFGRFAVRRIASERPQRTHARYTQSGTCRQTVEDFPCKALCKLSRRVLPFASRTPVTGFCFSGRLAAKPSSGGACRRRRTATVPSRHPQAALGNRGGL